MEISPQLIGEGRIASSVVHRKSTSPTSSTVIPFSSPMTEEDDFPGSLSEPGKSVTRLLTGIFRNILVAFNFVGGFLNAPPSFGDWYAPISEEVGNSTGSLMTGRITP